MLFVGLTIYLTDGRPIFFKQKRVGKNLIEFTILKFRTMRNEKRNSKKIEFTKKDDPRITSIGRILRKYSIDELPQLLNVFYGDMSIVGPRPDTPQQKSNYDTKTWKTRHLVKPGITGLAQVNGRSNINPEQRIHYDLKWVENKSINLYLSVIWKTFFIKVKDSV